MHHLFFLKKCKILSLVRWMQLFVKIEHDFMFSILFWSFYFSKSRQVELFFPPHLKIKILNEDLLSNWDYAQIYDDSYYAFVYFVLNIHYAYARLQNTNFNKFKKKRKVAPSPGQTINLSFNRHVTLKSTFYPTSKQKCLSPRISRLNSKKHVKLFTK